MLLWPLVSKPYENIPQVTVSESRTSYYQYILSPFKLTCISQVVDVDEWCLILKAPFLSCAKYMVFPNSLTSATEYPEFIMTWPTILIASMSQKKKTQTNRLFRKQDLSFCYLQETYLTMKEIYDFGIKEWKKDILRRNQEGK